MGWLLSVLMIAATGKADPRGYDPPSAGAAPARVPAAPEKSRYVTVIRTEDSPLPGSRATSRFMNLDSRIGPIGLKLTGLDEGAGHCIDLDLPPRKAGWYDSRTRGDTLLHVKPAVENNLAIYSRTSARPAGDIMAFHHSAPPASAEPAMPFLREEPLSDAILGPFRVAVLLTMFTILLIVWLRDELKQKAEREARARHHGHLIRGRRL